MGSPSWMIACRVNQRALMARALSAAVIAALVNLSFPLFAAGSCTCPSLFHFAASSSRDGCSCGDGSASSAPSASTTCRSKSDGRCGCDARIPQVGSHGGVGLDLASCAVGCCQASGSSAPGRTARLSPRSCACQVSSPAQDCAPTSSVLVDAQGAPVGHAAVQASHRPLSIPSTNPRVSPLLLTLRLRDRSPPHLS